MGWHLRVLCMLAGSLVFSVVLRLLIKRKMDEAHSLLWIPLGVIALVVGFFPDVAVWFADLLGVPNADSIVLVVIVMLLIVIIFKNTVDLSVSKAQNHELSMHVSMLNSEVRHLIEVSRVLSKNLPGDLVQIRHNIEKQHAAEAEAEAQNDEAVNK